MEIQLLSQISMTTGATLEITLSGGICKINGSLRGEVGTARVGNRNDIRELERQVAFNNSICTSQPLMSIVETKLSVTYYPFL